MLGLVHILLPFLVLPLYGSMRAIDRDYLKAAANLGANAGAGVLARVFPLSLPGLVAGALIVFILCLGCLCHAGGAGRRQGDHGRANADRQRCASCSSTGARPARCGVVLLVLTGCCCLSASRLARLDRMFGGHGT